ncbi:MAG: esterase [Elusimicrobia bacterium]|nr:esterase [Elusimicrobiota bacterium]
MRTAMALRRMIGGLDTITYKSGNAEAATLVLFHGYGADGADLAPIAGELPVREPIHAVFPDGPLVLKIDGVPSGRAWFPIAVDAIQKAQMAGKSVDWSSSEPGGMAKARDSAGEFLKALGVPWPKLIIGGFSQGAILAVDLALRSPEPPLGLAILSGNLVNEKGWRELAPKRKGLRFLQSHGKSDPILGYEGAKRLTGVLLEGGLTGELLTFEGGHGIPLAVIEELGKFIEKLA